MDVHIRCRQVLFWVLLNSFVKIWAVSDAKSMPIVMWHGMGDACCMPYSLGPFKDFLEAQIPGVYVKSIKIGDSIVEDLENGYFMSPNKQVEMVCEQLVQDANLQDGFNAIGFSQGSQFLRAVQQRCADRIPRMRNLITLGGQHQGVYGLPNCASLKHEYCDYMRRVLTYAAYYSWVQHSLVQATYWHDPLKEEEYQHNSNFLADINNEVAMNESYVRHLNKLQHFVMVKFEDDTIVEPKETEWFGFYEPGHTDKMLSLRESRIYLEERLGLRAMDLAGKLVFLASPGNHLHFTDKWFIHNIIEPYLL